MIVYPTYRRQQDQERQSGHSLLSRTSCSENQGQDSDQSGPKQQYSSPVVHPIDSVGQIPSGHSKG